MAAVGAPGVVLEARGARTAWDWPRKAGPIPAVRAVRAEDDRERPRPGTLPSLDDAVSARIAASAGGVLSAAGPRRPRRRRRLRERHPPDPPEAVERARQHAAVGHGQQLVADDDRAGDRRHAAVGGSCATRPASAIPALLTFSAIAPVKPADDDVPPPASKTWSGRTTSCCGAQYRKAWLVELDLRRGRPCRTARGRAASAWPGRRRVEQRDLRARSRPSPRRVLPDAEQQVRRRPGAGRRSSPAIFSSPSDARARRGREVDRVERVDLAEGHDVADVADEAHRVDPLAACRARRPARPARARLRRARSRSSRSAVCCVPATTRVLGASRRAASRPARRARTG